jgi:hypothetical protein
MDTRFRIIAVLAILFIFSAATQFSCQNRAKVTTENHVNVKPVPSGFKYYSRDIFTIVYDKPFHVRRIVGKVLDQNGNPINEALVEIAATNWVRISAQFTDLKGCFEFKNMKEGEYNIRIEKPLLTPIEATILITKLGKGEITFVLSVAT